ncbi:MAG: hypothetical protein KDD62_06745, partial [Bdellovibrionales bacterium]|nr:hypothetical protein [Bdellovibrionales bacterium]
DVCGDSDLARFVDRASHRKLIVDERGFVQIDEAEAAYKTDKRLMFLVPIAKDQNDAEALTNLGLRCLESDHLIRVAGDTEDHSLMHRRFHKDGLPTTSSIVVTRESSFAVNSAPQASAYFYKLLDSATFLLGDPAQDKLLLVSTYTDKRYDNVRAMEIEGYVTNVNFFEKPAAPRTNSATPEAEKPKSAAKSKRRAPKTKTEEAPEKPARAKAKSTTPKKRASESSKKATPSKQKAHTEEDTASKKRETKDRQPKKKS